MHGHQTSNYHFSLVAGDKKNNLKLINCLRPVYAVVVIVSGASFIAFRIKVNSWMKSLLLKKKKPFECDSHDLRKIDTYYIV